MSKQLAELYASKIASSGIDDKTAKKLKFEILDKAAVGKLGMPAYGGFKIPYFDVQGKLTDFYRIRYLEATQSGFKKLTNAKALRYAQPKGTVNDAYLPPLIDWAKVFKDPKIPIIITEGELKAAAGCAAGFNVIGLGGVWNFRSATHNLPLLPTLDSIDWSDRIVVILYDSDAVTNPKVMKAENALARELARRGAVVRIGRIPTTEGKKMGLDDLLLSGGKPALREALDKASIYDATKELFQLNTEVMYVRNPGLILRLDNLQRMAPRAFSEHAYSTRIYTETQIIETDKGTKTKIVEKCAPKEWMKWPHRSEVEKVVYEPGLPRVTDDKLNVWPGWGVEPKDGDIAPWKNLLTYIFRGDENAKTWFERWCAYPLQNPGVKLYQSCVIWGIHHGTGKSVIGYTLKAIYGANGTEIKDSNLQETHNEWAENKQFVMGDEITGGEKRGVADRLKGMITQQEIRLNPKYVPSYTVRDCINYYFTSNHPDSFFLEDNDRRYFIWEAAGKPLDKEFYKIYDAWLKNGGPSHLFAYLLNLDLGDFDPAGHAPMTDSKREMISTGKSDLAGWVAMLREDPDSVLRVDSLIIKAKLYRSEDLLRLYDPDMRTRVTANGLARELRKAGFDQVNNRMPCRTFMGQVRLWLVRDIQDEMWGNMVGDDLGKLYSVERGKEAKIPSNRGRSKLK